MSDLATYVTGYGLDEGMAYAALRILKENGFADAVIGNWSEASGSVRYVDSEGDMQTDVRQVADYSHKPWRAAKEWDADAVISIWYEDGWKMNVEGRDGVSHPVELTDEDQY